MPPQAEGKTDTQAVTARLPKDLHKTLRRLAYEQNTSINTLLVEAAQDKYMPRRA